MCPSILVHGDRHALFRDGDVFAVVAVLEHLLEHDELDRALAPLIATWRAELIHSGHGTVDFDLDSLDDALRGSVVEGLASAADYAERAWSAGVPLVVLARFDRDQIWYLPDPAAPHLALVPASAIAQHLRRLRDLVAHDDAADL
jgi:hypothetical protein